MPIKSCELEGKPGFKWGDSGKCYTHDGSESSIKKAKKKAAIQAVAAGYTDFTFAEFKITYGNTRTENNTIKSSNLWKFKYDDEKEELVLKFNDGSVYTYSNVPLNVFTQIVEGDGVCKTSGETKWGTWFEGKTPSVGAAIHDILVNGGFSFTRGGSV